MAGFSPKHIELLDHARMFSSVMHGAALIYNIALAEERGWLDKQEEHEATLDAWLTEIDMAEVRNWSLSHLWGLTMDHGHTITPPTQRFVEQWVAAVIARGEGIGEDDSARKLVRRREISVKNGRSRFTNRRALDQWGGSSGLGRMTYRWPNASTFLEDLYDGLHREGEG